MTSRTLKTRLPLLFLLPLIAVSAHAQSAPDPSSWQRYTIKDKVFSVTLPALPSLLSFELHHNQRKKDFKEHVLATSAGGVIFSVYVCTNPKPQQSLENFIKEQTVKSQLDLATERNLSVNGFAGKEYSSRDKTKPATEQFFATDRHLFRFVASGASGNHAGVSQFFSSIVLSRDAEGIKVSDGPGKPLEPDGLKKAFVGREVDRKAMLISKPEPMYTDAGRSHRVKGTVVLRAVLSYTGEVINLKTVAALPHGMTEQALGAAREIKFVPAMKDGRYVSMWIQLEYNFTP